MVFIIKFSQLDKKLPEKRLLRLPVSELKYLGAGFFYAE